LSVHSATRPVPVLRWSPTTRRRVEAVRDRIMTMCGTSEALIPVGGDEFPLGHQPVTLQWRKPLSIPEVNRLAPTQEVRERRGRP
jgi:hypothetical protein